VRRLIVRPGAIGDFIVSIPAMEFLRANYTEVWTTSTNIPLARFADHADSIIATGLDALQPGPEVMRRLASFDSIVSWYGSNRPAFREAMKHLPVTFHKALPPQSGGQHAVDYYLSQAGAPAGAIPRLPVKRHDEGFIAIHPFSGGRVKNWPLDRFSSLAAQLPEPVQWIAGPEEALDHAIRFDDLWSLANWLAGAMMFIGNDSGISHLAAACGVPVLALFGPTDPKVWAPRGDLVRLAIAPDGRMESLSVQEILAICEDMRRRL